MERFPGRRLLCIQQPSFSQNAQLGQQRNIAAKTIQRQITVMAIVASRSKIITPVGASN